MVVGWVSLQINYTYEFSCKLVNKLEDFKHEGSQIHNIIIFIKIENEDKREQSSIKLSGHISNFKFQFEKVGKGQKHENDVQQRKFQKNENVA